MQEMAFAKLNLALHVRGRQSDGYHDIETLFAFCEDGDLLTVENDDELGLAVTGPFAADVPVGGANLVLQAAERLRNQAGVTAGARISLEKRLPVASGIGGGSADAGAALRLLNRFWDLPASERELETIATSLGSDVPACLFSLPARGERRGDRLTELPSDSLSGTAALLVNPRIPVSTAAVFARWDGVDGGHLPDGDILDVASAARNGLEAPAVAIAPEIGAVLAALRSCAGTRLVRMSGSGATCFALFEGEADRDAAARAVAAEHPSWWQLATRLR